ncbi:MAG: NAD-dependent epimerase/dehydratase family protein [Candidatus Niyogibacteria bacterium]|nr:NAD-dependent epimerase/dehydratase family protein [Candidatus Niyogibacteria bacterium]
MNPFPKKVLVTGGVGFIGSHIVDTLLLRGCSVSIVDIGERTDTRNEKASYYHVDISDRASLEGVFKKEKPEAIIHAGALARIQPSFKDPERYFMVNALGTANILSLSKKYSVKRVIYSASSSAYGDQEMPLQEHMAVATQAYHPYGSTKRMGEMLMRDMGIATGGPETVCLRYFNVYGPRQTTEADGPYATVIGIFFEQSSRNAPLTVVPDGHQRRDFTYVSDVVEANLQALVSPHVGRGEIINVGFGNSNSIWDVVRFVYKLDGSIIPDEMIKKGYATYAPERRGEARETLAHTALAEKLLGWKPRVSFEEGIERTREFYRKQGWNV